MQQLQQIEPLQQLPRLKYTLKSNKRECLKYPSSLELISLSMNLCYKLHLIINENERLPKDKTKNDYILKAIEIQKILDDYQNSFIDIREFNQIKKEFCLNRLYE